jgi:outer membrane receptor for ferrienterochelin and colicins
MQLETGLTYQSSLYDEPVQNIEGLESKREFLRTPDLYGYGKLTITPTKQFSMTINLVYTGTMEVVHFAGAPEQDVDAYVMSPDFTDISFKTGYTFNLKNIDTGIELFGGIKNFTNSYQNDFDTGKNRDSNYIYGPGLPRTLFLGLKLKSL